MIVININKAKNIAHDIRRAKREEEFAPLDAVIMKQIPGVNASEVEAERQAIRDKYTIIQQEINSATNVDTIKLVLDI